MTKVVLDAEAFKALASDTRLQILKALDARPLTVSEMSRLLNLNKATVFEHLKQLMTADLTKREDDPARKWVYYRLTWKGRNVLHPENVQIFLMLGLGAFGIGGAILQTAHILSTFWGGGGAASAEPGGGGGNLSDAPSPRVEAAYAGDSKASASSTASATTSSAPAAGAPAPTSSTSPKQSGLDQRVADGPIEDTQGGSGGAGVTGTDWALIVGILVLLLLVALIAWTLFQNQRRERAQVVALIDLLPANVNEAEKRVS